MDKLSAVIITKNEASNIGRCLESLSGLTEDIVVVDDRSTDRTEAICASYRVRFIQHAWEGYGHNKNYGNELAKHNWILSLDADEALSPELAQSIRDLPDNPPAPAYSLAFMTNYAGQWIRHGRWFPEHHVRLFDKRQVSWNTDAVHEGLNIPSGMVIPRLKGLVRHYSMRSIAHHLEKVNLYTSLAAEKMFQNNKRPSRIKLYLNPPFRFLSDYIFRLGFLDGFYGFCIAAFCSYETFLKYAKLKELYKNRKEANPE